MRSGDRIRALEHRVTYLEQALMALRDRPLPISPTPYPIPPYPSWIHGTGPFYRNTNISTTGAS